MIPHNNTHNHLDVSTMTQTKPNGGEVQDGAEEDSHHLADDGLKQN
jgi:hypothetical protein